MDGCCPRSASLQCTKANKRDTSVALGLSEFTTRCIQVHLPVVLRLGLEVPGSEDVVDPMRMQ